MTKERCKYIYPGSSGRQCGVTFMLFSDGLCIHHSLSKEAKLARAKGRQARKDKLSIRKGLKTAHQNALDQIRLKCRDCSDTYSDLMFCSVTGCPLWQLRFGIHAEIYIRGHGKGSRMLFEPKNFETDAMFGNNKEAEECLENYKKLQEKE